MRHHRLIAAAALAATVAPSTARADDTIFDFVGPRAGQEGNYVTGPGAIVSGGVGTLGPRAGWFDESWSHRLPLIVTNPNAAALAEFQVSLFVDATTALGDAVFSFGQPTGADLRVVSGGSVLTETSRGAFDLSDNRGRLWFQVPSLAAGDTAMELYFGHPTTATIDDPLATFSYAAPYASRYALEPDGVTMVIASMTAGNDYMTGAISGTLLAGGTVSITAGNWTVGQTIASLAPVDVGYDVNAASQGVPISFARTVLAGVISRGDPDQFRLLSPFADTTVDVAYDGVSAGTVSLTAGVAGVWEDSIPANTVVTLSAAAPILASYRGLDNVDGIVMPPAGAEVWGVRSGTPRIHALGGDTDVVVYDSTGATTTLTVTGGGFATLAAGGSGTGDALVAYATDATTGAPAPIAIIANGDGDGGDAIVLFPESELGRTWVVPTDGRFAIVGLSQPGARCTMTAPDATVTTVFATTLWPARVKFGADTGTNIVAGSIIDCAAPGFAYYEDAATDDERNLFPMEAHRKAAPLPVTAALATPLETRYDAAVAATVDTPDAVAATAIQQWTDFRVAVLEPANTSIGYQISLDGGASYIVPSSPTSWVAAPTTADVATAGDIRDALGALDTTTGRIRVRAVLESGDGVARPAVDSIRVFFDQTGSATGLSWDPLPETVLAGFGFTVVITAVDSAGTRITGLDGPVALSTSHAGDVFPMQTELAGGQATLDIKVTGTGDDIRVRAVGPGGIAGDSEPFDLVVPDGATLTIFDGNNQFGPVGSVLGEPLAVQLRDGSDTPIAGAQVTYAVIEGNGLLVPAEASSAAAITDGQGVARMQLRLGDLGAQRIRAEAAGEMVELHARADEPGARADTGGCGCRTGARASSTGTAPALLLFVLALRRRRRRRRQ